MTPEQQAFLWEGELIYKLGGEVGKGVSAWCQRHCEPLVLRVLSAEVLLRLSLFL